MTYIYDLVLKTMVRLGDPRLKSPVLIYLEKFLQLLEGGSPSTSSGLSGDQWNEAAEGLDGTFGWCGHSA